MMTDDIREQITNWIKRYPAEHKRSGVFEALRLVQDKNGGSLTTELMNEVADFLGMPHIAVYEVATFYSMYELAPVGKHVINVCTNISCSLNNVEAAVEYLEKTLGIKMGETTADKQFTLKEVECLGACVAPPVCQVGNKYYENFTVERAEKLLGELNGK